MIPVYYTVFSFFNNVLHAVLFAQGQHVYGIHVKYNVIYSVKVIPLSCTAHYLLWGDNIATS